MLLFAVAMKPFGGLITRGRSVRKPFHSYLPVPGTGSRPTQPRRFGVSAEPWIVMLPSTSPQIRFSVGAFQYIARVEKLLAVRRLRQPQAAEIRRRSRARSSTDRSA